MNMYIYMYMYMYIYTCTYICEHGNTMFTVQIYNRLKDTKGSSLPFGGVSIGDLFQLQPVMDGYIFKDIDNNGY